MTEHLLYQDGNGLGAEMPFEDRYSCAPLRTSGGQAHWEEIQG